jgi:hypothetical protein
MFAAFCLFFAGVAFGMSRDGTGLALLIASALFWWLL